ncbi:MAG: histidine phosphatase family protein [Proteobacteria bacterium]|nr:histidine phosphatase family protein [Pseudomonadota bacterium]
MKRLTLMRHADARWKDSDVPDFERPLNRRGTSDAESMARRLTERGLVPDLILASAARRTQQTAEILARTFGENAPRVMREETLYLATAAEILRMAQASGPRIEHLLLVAHNPGVSELVQLLLPQATPSELPAAGLCSIAFGCDGWDAIGPGAIMSAVHEAPPSGLFGLFV